MHGIGDYSFADIGAIVGLLTSAFSFVIWMLKKLVMDRLSFDMQTFKRSIDILAQTLDATTKRLDSAEKKLQEHTVLLAKHDVRITDLRKEEN
ncbi:hypothetical protein [Brochothrix campestris]|uniref:Uncharacterized protein n=1 Tax=Brochothrix campestris FSL F6-1037 TaxID=1265861 RepID=W7CYG3_9LIST|nr:hypothetical protein [Brochothrix campestris]EUJ41987.1 hypothetical protein BCAMP_01240 [Brochothrix campestris FSL F6-1037]